MTGARRPKTRRRAGLLAAMGFVLGWPAAVAAQPYSPPPSDFTAYWEVPAFKEFPYRGPAAATGVILWSHGVAGTQPEWQYPPPPVMRRFARDGWDVVKVQRNNLFEAGWSISGTKHVAYLVERIAKARQEGYAYVIAAGQSYGGAISLEASARTDQLFGVIAFAPGHGSDTCGSPTAGITGRRIADNLQQMLVEVIKAAKAPRTVVSMADGDECQGFNAPTQLIEDALRQTPARFIHFSAAMPIRGHAAAETNQFDRWYGDCLTAFFDPAKTPPGGETTCPTPSPVPRFLFPADYKFPAAATGTLVGQWSGAYASATSTADYNREVCVVIDGITDGGLQTVTAFGPGFARELSMTVSRRQFARDRDRFVFHGTNNYVMTLAPAAATGTIGLSITSADRKTTWTGTLKPGC